jgi:taurine dioxygenase
MASYNVGPLPGDHAFGAVVTGLTADMLDDPRVRKDLTDLWVDKGVIVFRGVEGLDIQLALSEIFGEPAEHPLLVGIKDQPRTHHVIADINYAEGHGDLYLINGEEIGGYLPWHFDLAYVDKINHGGILRPHVLPDRGGETGFIDQITTYESLPQRLKDEIEDLEVIYTYQTDSSIAKFGDRPDKCLHLSPEIVRAASHPVLQQRAIHPLVYTQAETGRKVVNISPWHAQGIVGRENEEGDALLREVIDFSIRPERAYFHKWQPGDMVLWDNWRMMHCASGVPSGEQRRMGRTTISGDYGLGRWEHAEEDELV